jgi:hypothetical protein
MPHLSVPQARVLAWWREGIALTRACGRLTGATFLALLLGQKVATVEPRLYEWCGPAAHKAGAKRQALDVTTGFVPLLRWVVALWAGSQMALARDATSLGARFGVLTLHGVYRGGAVPVAWTVWPAHQPGAWGRAWWRLLRQVRPAIPPNWTVLVLTDRGLWARWLFRRMVRLGWHPLRRMNQGAKFRPAGHPRWYWLRELVGAVNQHWCGRGTAFVAPARRVDCTLVAWWGKGYTAPWFLLPELAPEGCDAAWYGLRGWCEQGCKGFTRGGWPWQYTQMTAPERAARLWLALAVAPWWMVSVGGALEVGPQPGGMAMPELRPLLGRTVATPDWRRLRLRRLGWLWGLVCQITAGGWPMPRWLVPAPWPDLPAGVLIVTLHQNT